MLLYQLPLARRQAVGLQHIGGLQGLQESLALRQGLLRKGAVARRGDIVALHEGFGIVLAALQQRTLFRRSDDHDVLQRGLTGKVVGNAAHQRGLGSHHQHLHPVRQRKLTHGLEVHDVQLHILSQRLRARVAGSYIELPAQRTLCYLVGYRMLASARSEE